MTGVLIERAQVHREGKQCGDIGRTPSTSPGTPETTRSWERRETDSPSQP